MIYFNYHAAAKKEEQEEEDQYLKLALRQPGV